MFKLKKSMKKVIGLALAGVVLTGGVPVNAASTDEPNTPVRQTYEYAGGEVITSDALTGSISYCDTPWSKVKKSINKNLLGVIEGMGNGYIPVNPKDFIPNHKNIALYDYYCVANSSKEIVTEEGSKGYDQVRRVQLKNLGMTTSKKNHFPEINDSSKWAIEVLTKTPRGVYSDEWANATVTLWNKLTCQKCKSVTWKEGRCSDTDTVFEEKVKGRTDCLTSDIKHHSCKKCGTKGNWKVSSELELHHDASIDPANIYVYEKNVAKNKTAKFGAINFYSYLNGKHYHAAGLCGGSDYSNSNGIMNLTSWVRQGGTTKVTVKKGDEIWYHDEFHSPAKLKTSKSSVVSVSNKIGYSAGWQDNMGMDGSYHIVAKKKGTATVTVTNIWGHKYTFKITVK